jgi:hypothetical protein
MVCSIVIAVWFLSSSSCVWPKEVSFPCWPCNSTSGVDSFLSLPWRRGSKLDPVDDCAALKTCKNDIRILDWLWTHMRLSVVVRKTFCRISVVWTLEMGRFLKKSVIGARCAAIQAFAPPWPVDTRCCGGLVDYETNSKPAAFCRRTQTRWFCPKSKRFRWETFCSCFKGATHDSSYVTLVYPDVAERRGLVSAMNVDTPASRFILAMNGQTANDLGQRNIDILWLSPTVFISAVKFRINDHQVMKWELVVSCAWSCSFRLSTKKHSTSLLLCPLTSFSTWLLREVTIFS